MIRYAPMLAAPMHKAHVADWRHWAVEEKVDGHRMMFEVTSKRVTAYARPRKRGEMLTRELPSKLAQELQRLPPGVYDGELVGGDTSTDVTRLDLRDGLQVVLFDLLEVTRGGSTYTLVGQENGQRRALLAEAYMLAGGLTRVRLVDRWLVSRQSEVTALVKAVWAKGGEGVILKRLASHYASGKRNTDWVKIKKEQHATLRLTAFEPSRGTVRFPGHPFGILVLTDEDGTATTVKAKDDALLHALMAAWHQAHGVVKVNGQPHPWLGRKVIIEYQDRTREGAYRHPRFDRWEDE